MNNPVLPDVGGHVSGVERDVRGDGIALVQDVLTLAELVGGSAEIPGVDLALYSAGAVIGAPFALPGDPAHPSTVDCTALGLFDSTKTVTPGDVELAVFGADPGYTNHNPFDVTYASLGTVPELMDRIVFDRASDSASSRLLTETVQRRRLLFRGTTNSYFVLVARAPITFGSAPHLVVNFGGLRVA